MKFKFILLSTILVLSMTSCNTPSSSSSLISSSPSTSIDTRTPKEKVLEVCDKIINDFLTSKNYKAPYWRITVHDNNVHIDVGSWSEFFRIELEKGEKYELCF